MIDDDLYTRVSPMALDALLKRYAHGGREA
jgi:hypothetical protein